MSRTVCFVIFVCAVFFTNSNSIFAQPDQINQAIRLQNAIKLGREALSQKKPQEAVRILEESILFANGQTAYLELLRDAYIAAIKELQLKNGSDEMIAHIRKQLKTLELSVGTGDAKKGAVAAKSEEVRTPSPADKSAETMNPKVDLPPLTVEDPKVAEPEKKTEVAKVAKEVSAPAVDSGLRLDAARLFGARKYREASEKFAAMEKNSIPLREDEKQCWAFCRLEVVAERWKANLDSDPSASKNEVLTAMALGGKPVKSFGDALLEKLSTVETPVTADTFATSGRNFVVHSISKRLKGEEISRYAEQLRSLALERWTGSKGIDWKIPCEIYLYETAEAYARATGKPASHPGHSTVKFDGGKVVSRRIDLHLEASELFEAQLPREIHYVVMSELFSEEPLPVWAELGMTTLAEPAAHRSRNRRMAARLIEERKLLKLEKVFEATASPNDSSVTSFYLASVTVVDYLVRLKGYRTFVVFLQESPRRGVEKSPSQHYGIKSLAELEKKWQADLLRGE